MDTHASTSATSETLPGDIYCYKNRMSGGRIFRTNIAIVKISMRKFCQCSAHQICIRTMQLYIGVRHPKFPIKIFMLYNICNSLYCGYISLLLKYNQSDNCSVLLEYIDLCLIYEITNFTKVQLIFVDMR